MARPLKQGLEYFPLDVRMFRDKKIRVLSYLAGPLAEIIYIRILTMIYENGYYLEVSIDELSKILHIDIGPQWHRIERISECVNACLEAGLFDKTLAAQGVITAESVQRQYLLSTQRRKDIDITKYWLLESSPLTREGDSLSASKFVVNDNKNIVNADNNQVFDDINTQSKSKRENDKKINIDKRALGEPKLHFITNALIKNKYIKADDLSIGRFNLLFVDLVDRYGFDVVLSVSDYIVKMSKKGHIEISDKYEYFKASAERNAVALINQNKGGKFDIAKEIKAILRTMD